jgi:predicted amidohydrolase YtcJ
MAMLSQPDRSILEVSIAVGFDDAPKYTRNGNLRARGGGSAYAGTAERVKGTIETGKLADFVVLSEDPTAVAPGRLAGLEVLATIIGGEQACPVGALLADAIVRV